MGSAKRPKSLVNMKRLFGRGTSKLSDQGGADMSASFAGYIPEQSTHATFWRGSLAEQGRILLAWADGTRCLVVTDRSPFHPWDYSWRDQPGDRGEMRTGGAAWRVLDSLTWPLPKGGSEITYSSELAVKRGDEGCLFLTAHVVVPAAGGPAQSVLNEINEQGLIGAEAELEVDGAYRLALSRPHSACHLTALALNRALHPLWRKESAPDSLGSFDFDSAAIASSRLAEGASIDSYRLGKSLRKKGFSAEALLADLPRYREQIERTVNQWIGDGAASRIEIEAADERLGALRIWKTRLEGREARIPCGGTHVDTLSAIGAVSIELLWDEAAGELRVMNRV
jgi:alanyl-tRNA synthetase